MRAGVYVFFDLVMAGISVCAIDDIALSVLCTVIGHQHDKGWIIVDSGWMALSSDRGTMNQKIDQGYGMVCDISGNPVDGLVVGSTNQEHGIIKRRDGDVPTARGFRWARRSGSCPTTHAQQPRLMSAISWSTAI